MTATSNASAITPPAARGPDMLSGAAGAAYLLWIASGYWTVAPMSITSALLATATALLWASRPGARWNASPADLGAIAWGAAMLLATAFALDRAASLPRLTKIAFPFLAGLSAWHARDERLARRAVAVALASSSLAAIYGLVGFGMRGASFASRARGPVGHYITFAGQLAIATALALAIAFVAKERRWRLGATACAALCVAALVATFTRSSWLGLIAGSALMLALARPLALLPLAALVAGIATFAPGDYRARLWSVFDLSSRWNEQRQYMWQAGWKMFRDHPLTGVGLQDLHALYEQYRPPGATEAAGHLHSVPVQVAATMGLAGLAALAALLFSLARTVGMGLRARLRTGGLPAAIALGAAGALVAFTVAGLFEWNLGDEEVLHPLYALVGLAWASRSWAAPASARERPRGPA